MDDGAVLLADRWVAAAAEHRRQPSVLVRSPYGNPGTGEDPVRATTLEPVDVEVLFGPERPFALVLPSQG